MSGLSRLGSWQKRGPDVTRVSRGAQVVSQDISTLCTHPNFQFKKLFDLFFVNLSETKQGKGESDLCNMIHSSNIYFPPSYLPCAIFMFNVSIKRMGILGKAMFLWRQQHILGFKKLWLTYPALSLAQHGHSNARTENVKLFYNEWNALLFLLFKQEKLKFIKDINKHFSQS